MSMSINFGCTTRKIADNTVYKFYGIVQHISNGSDGGHYTAITHDDTENRWHKYDDKDVNICKFQNRSLNKALVRFQKTARILFYIRKGPERQIINESIMGDTTRRLNNNNGKPTNTNIQHVIKYSPQIHNAHTNTIIFDSPHSRL